MLTIFIHFPTVQALGRESDQLRDVSHKYENDKKLWSAAISNMERKIKVKLI
jgi:kinesin family protein C2/C3